MDPQATYVLRHMYQLGVFRLEVPAWALRENDRYSSMCACARSSQTSPVITLRVQYGQF